MILFRWISYLMGKTPNLGLWYAPNTYRRILTSYLFRYREQSTEKSLNSTLIFGRNLNKSANYKEPSEIAPFRFPIAELDLRSFAF